MTHVLKFCFISLDFDDWFCLKSKISLIFSSGFSRWVPSNPKFLTISHLGAPHFSVNNVFFFKSLQFLKIFSQIFSKISGVHAVEIDRKQQKVTVTTITDAETLIKKLVKAGKHAEPWPEKKPNSKNFVEIQIPKEILAGETSAAVQDGESKKQRAETEAAKEVNDPPKNEEKGEISGNAQVAEMINDGGDAAEKIAGAGVGRVVKSPPEGGGEKCTAGEAQPGGPSGAVAVESSGGEGRRKKKKGQKKGKSVGGGGGAAAGNEVGPQSVPAPASTGSATPPDHHDQIPPLNHGPPCHQPYHYPVHMPVSQPAYVASYNTAHPSSSYGPYYVTPSPFSYAYVHSTVSRDISSSYSSSPPLPPVEQSNSPSSSPFDFFSDENPSGCSIM
ncbi:heavy metal-associated isoprenylated plant protein 35-like [Momordica charantia]|uniref:Heavy metal-associated isoprenylated plant protein 35-like n=1 Tax=Momordica charantia TaxID=3673 RepID=A0A6J1CWN2_MOMCH|nr:heavy metal-associated isoprenylated plant protein 35-like [Momordica charantia]